jgi:hypothetical protein
MEGDNEISTLKKELIKLAINLVVEKGVPHKELTSEIHNAITEAVKELPKIPVLYNRSYGGYEYSKDFLSYLNEDNSVFYVEKAKRIKHADLMKYYGAKCIIQFPNIARMIATYNSLKLFDLFTIAANVKTSKERIDSVAATREKVLKVDKTLFGKKNDVNYINVHWFNFQDVIQYSQIAILEYLDGQMQIYGRTYEEANNLLIQEIVSNNLPESMYQDICNSMYFMFTEERDIHETPFVSNRKQWIEKMTRLGLKKRSFTDAINDYGENHFAIWMCQSHYKEDAMRFLLQFPQYIVTDTSLCNSLDIGLLCASTHYCTLAIEYVPPIVHWYIGEYDGKENVVY